MARKMEVIDEIQREEAILSDKSVKLLDSKEVYMYIVSFVILSILMYSG